MIRQKIIGLLALCILAAAVSLLGPQSAAAWRQDYILPQAHIGSSDAYFTDFDSGREILQLYVEDATMTGSTAGLGVHLRGKTYGDGAASFKAIYGQANILSSGRAASSYGGYFHALQGSSGDVDDTLAGVYGLAQITASGNYPADYVAGVLGEYNTSGGNPTVLLSDGFKAALGGIIAGNTTSLPHAAVLAYLAGGNINAGVGAAFKAISTRSHANGHFEYGLDLYDELAAGSGNIGTADLRGHSGATIDNTSANLWTVNRGLALSPSTDTALLTTATLVVTRGVMRVAGSGGAISLTSTPSLADGADGQQVLLQGTSNSNTLTLRDADNLPSTGLYLAWNTDCVLGQGDTLQLLYDSGDDRWYEIGRSDN